MWNNQGMPKPIPAPRSQPTATSVKRKVAAADRYVSALVALPWADLELDADSMREVKGLWKHLKKLMETINLYEQRLGEEKPSRGRSTGGIPQAAKKSGSVLKKAT